MAGTTRHVSKHSKIDELRSKYKSEHTIYEKNQGQRNNSAFLSKAVQSLKTQHYEINNSITDASIDAAKDLQFQTIQDKPAIVIEDENEEQMEEHIEGMLLQEDCVQEDSVVIKKPISSKKSKSLENISKASKQRALLDVYKKQFQLQEHCEKAKDGSSIKIATIDISYAKLFQDKASSRLSTTRDNPASHCSSQNRVAPPTNFIKKNIKFVASLHPHPHENSTLSLAQPKSQPDQAKIKD